jgi:hypothetical protein
MALPTYTLGTVSVTHGSTVVTLSGGDWSGPNARELDNISINSLDAVLVTEVTDKLHLKIPPWQGADQVNVPYVIYQSYGGRVVGVAAAKDVGSMLATLRVAALAPIFIIEGNSHSADTGGKGTWPSELKASVAFFNRGTFYNFATSGDTLASMMGEDASQAASVLIQPGQESYYFCYPAANDLGAGTAAATIYANETILWAANRARGSKVIAFTEQPRIDGTTINNQRIALNALIRSDSTLYDCLIEPDLYFTDTADLTTFTSDGHLTAAANKYLASKIAAAILGVEPVPAAPFDAIPSGIELNGAMEVDQRNGGTAVTGISAGINQLIDGVSIHASGAGVCTAQQVADAPPGFSNSFKVTVTTANASPGSGDRLWIRMPIEGTRSAKLAWGGVNAAWITLGFFTKFHQTGMFGGSAINAAADRSYPFNFTQNVADAWEFKTIQIPGDVAGTWIGNTNGIGLGLYFALLSGSGVGVSAAAAWSAGLSIGTPGMVNGMSSTSNTFQITAVKILPGRHTLYAGRMRRIFRPYEEELKACRRRLMVYGSEGLVRNALASGYCFDATTFMAIFPRWAERMRAAPTLSVSGASQFEVVTGGAALAPSAMVIFSPSTDGGQITCTVSGATADKPGFLRTGNNSTARVILDATL